MGGSLTAAAGVLSLSGDGVCGEAASGAADRITVGGVTGSDGASEWVTVGMTVGSRAAVVGRVSGNDAAAGDGVGGATGAAVCLEMVGVGTVCGSYGAAVCLEIVEVVCGTDGAEAGGRATERATAGADVEVAGGRISLI